jgi:multidrug resistance efflux pump
VVGVKKLSSWLDSGSAACQRSNDRNQDDRANKGDYDAADQANASARKQNAEYEPADKRADDAQDDVPNNAVAAALHELTREPARDEANCVIRAKTDGCFGGSRTRKTTLRNQRWERDSPVG